jgi:hypothetical protein
MIKNYQKLLNDVEDEDNIAGFDFSNRKLAIG